MRPAKLTRIGVTSQPHTDSPIGANSHGRHSRFVSPCICVVIVGLLLLGLLLGCDGYAPPSIALGVETLAKPTFTASAWSLSGILAEPSGAVVVVAGHSIRRLHPNGTVTLVAGSDVLFGFADGVGANARFNFPYGITRDDDDVLYVADSRNRRIRRIHPNSSVTTIAGSGMIGHEDNVVGVLANFSGPLGLVWVSRPPRSVYSGPHIYVVDYILHRIRDITMSFDFQVVTHSGSSLGFQDGTRTGCRYKYPTNIAYDAPRKLLYIADSGNNAIRVLDYFANTVQTVVADQVVNYQDMFDPIDSTRRGFRVGAIAMDEAENMLYMLNGTDCSIRRVDLSSNSISVLAGSTGQCASPVDGPFSTAVFESMQSIAYFINKSEPMYQTTTLLISDNISIRRVAASIFTESFTMTVDHSATMSATVEASVDASSSVSTSGPTNSVDMTRTTTTTKSGLSATLSPSPLRSTTQSAVATPTSTCVPSASGQTFTRTRVVSPTRLSKSLSFTRSVSITEGLTHGSRSRSPNATQSSELLPTATPEPTMSPSKSFSMKPTRSRSLQATGTPTISSTQTTSLTKGSRTANASLSQALSVTPTVQIPPTDSASVTATPTAPSLSIRGLSATPTAHTRTASTTVWFCSSLEDASVHDVVIGNVANMIHPAFARYNNPNENRTYVAGGFRVLTAAADPSQPTSIGGNVSGARFVVYATSIPRLALLGSDVGGSRFPWLRVNVTVRNPAGALRWQIARIGTSSSDDDVGGENATTQSPLAFDDATTNTDGFHDILVQPPPGAPQGWLGAGALLYRPATFTLNIRLECDASYVGSLRVVLPSAGADKELSEQIFTVARVGLWMSVVSGAGTGSALGRITAIRSLMFCSVDGASTGGLLGLSMDSLDCTETPAEYVEPMANARGAVEGNLALVAGASIFLGVLVLVLHLKIIRAKSGVGSSLLSTARRMAYPSTLLPLWVATLPSTAGAATLLATNLPFCGSDAAFVLISAITCLGPLFLILAVCVSYISNWELHIISQPLVERRRDESSSCKQQVMMHWLRTTRPQWRWEVYGSRNETSNDPSPHDASDATPKPQTVPSTHPSRHAWVVLEEYRHVWFLLWDSAVLVIAGVFGIISGLGNGSVCTGSAGVVIVLYATELILCAVSRPFNNLFSLVYTLLALNLSCLSVAFQTAYIVRVSTGGMKSAAEMLSSEWMMSASAVCDSCVMGITFARLLIDLVESCRRLWRFFGDGWDDGDAVVIPSTEGPPPDFENHDNVKKKGNDDAAQSLPDADDVLRSFYERADNNASPQLRPELPLFDAFDPFGPPQDADQRSSPDFISLLPELRSNSPVVPLQHGVPSPVRRSSSPPLPGGDSSDDCATSVVFKATVANATDLHQAISRGRGASVQLPTMSPTKKSRAQLKRDAASNSSKAKHQVSSSKKTRAAAGGDLFDFDSNERNCAPLSLLGAYSDDETL